MTARLRLRAAGAAAMVTAAGCQLIGGIDSRSLGPDDGGADSMDSSDGALGADGIDMGKDGGASDGRANDAGGTGDAGLDAPTEARSDADAGRPYSAEVLADSPLAYWRLDDVVLVTAKDSSGNHNDATYVGGVAHAAGAIVNDADTAVTLDGTNGYIDAGSKLAFTGRVPFTIEAWIQPTIIDASYRGVMSNEAQPVTGKEGYLLYLQTPAAGGIGFDRYQTGASTPLTAAGAVVATTTTWYHVAGVYDGTTMSLWVDGRAVASSATVLSIQSAACVFAIGATHCGASGFLKGGVDEVAVYGTALSASRLSTHYHVGSGR